ncbi:MAG: hypothetical protein WB767_08750 [Nocardioides sp.]
MAQQAARGATRYDFEFAPSYRLPGLVLGITGSTAWVEIGPDGLFVRFGLWRLRTSLANVVRVSHTTNYAWWKTAGPPHLSFADGGVTFATNGDRGICVGFDEPVRVLDPTGRLRHPGATMTLADPQRFEEELRDLQAAAL